MNITVFLASSTGNDPKFITAIRELGTWIGPSGHTLVYGGSKTGLMGELAHSVLAAGGKVIGVEPQFFMDEDFQYDGLTQLIVTKDMAEMLELGEAFIAFPGVVGTLEEVSEIMSKLSLGHINAPCIYYNLDGYYDDMKCFLQHMIAKVLSSEVKQKGVYFAENRDEIKRILN